DSASRKQFQKMLAHRVADTALQDYYAQRRGGYTSAIPDWCYKVEERVRKVLHEGSKACSRCKLRDLPPCCATED
ncbi:MAG: hypothetical protein KJ645_01140, partial [Planctomycetes bacterium]|nr:hypothetical protein [Planctomycetota bacterium]